jgi:L-histidine Nalpha-methyltransferase
VKRSSQSVTRVELAGQDGAPDFRTVVSDGLSKLRKSLPCQFFYDERGSQLFEQITRLPEYYPTRTEVSILRAHIADIVAGVPDSAALIEFGSGSSIKTEQLLQNLPATVAYVPIDVSPSALADAKQRLAHRFPKLAIYPVIGSFTEPIELPESLRDRPRVGFFPGSTIGNWTPESARGLLESFRDVLGSNGRLILGVDLKKDAKTLVKAYNDRAGVTAAFNLNILARINRELGSAIDLSTFRHEAIYDPRQGRIEMHLVSSVAQSIAICGRRFEFRAGERIHTENSYKYTVPEFQNLAQRAGWLTGRVWTDAASQFSVHELIAPARSAGC